METLVKAAPQAVPVILKNLEPYRQEVSPRLREIAEDKDLTTAERTRVSLALLPDDRGQLNDLYDQLQECTVDEFPLIRDALQPYKASLLERLRQSLKNERGNVKTLARFHAGMALAAYAPEDNIWSDAAYADFLAEQLLTSNPDYQRDLREFLKPISKRLLEPLEQRFHEASERSVQEAAANALVDFAGDDPARLARMASEATTGQHKLLYPSLEKPETIHLGG